MLHYSILLVLISLITACGGQASITQSDENIVIIKANRVNFMDAYDLAKSECEKYEKKVRYIQDYSERLTVVAFECWTDVIEEADESAQSVDTTEVQDETTEAELNSETVPQEPEDTNSGE